MADSKEHSSDKTTYRTEWNPDDAPPQYNMAPASNPFRSPSPATHANRGFDTSYRNGEPDAAAYQYMPPVDPPPPSSSSSSGAYADMPKPGYGYDQSPYQGEGSSSSAGMYRSPSSSSAYMAAPSSEAYARGQTGPSLGPAPSAQPGFGSGGRGLLGIRGSGGFGLRDMLATNRSDNPTGTSGGGRAGLMGTRGGGRAGLMGMLANAGADSSRDVLSTPPPSFSRAPQPQFPYSPFPPLVVLSLDKSLAHGFPTIPPASHVQPHPFMAHDVNEDDWTQFLRNIHQVGTTTSPMSNVGRSGIVGTCPFRKVRRLHAHCFPAGTLVSMGTDAVMGGDKSGPATQIVEHWNAVCALQPHVSSTIPNSICRV